MEPVMRTNVLIVGAGISGISAACHLETRCPDRSYVILEGRSGIGGTWDLFRYPGVRSDSDMHTLGFKFKPWIERKAIADAPSIMKYLRETVAEHGVESKIRFNTQVERAEWNTATSTWTLTVKEADTGHSLTYEANFLFMCAGYYSYKGGYLPEFPGYDRFRGELVHPQEWPEDLDYANKRVLVVGSGATAMTVVPSMADKAAHVTMLQRSPTYVVARPDEDAINLKLRKYLPEKLAYAVTRKKNVVLSQYFYNRTRRRPEKVKELLLGGVKHALGPDFDVETHFTPRYNPWDERMCLLPNGDLFKAIRSGKVDVVTDTIDTFTEHGILLKSGRELEADIIITATGLNVVTLGEVEFLLDGQPIDFGTTWTYKGMGYSDVPNLISTFGYVNASWTLRADLNSEYVCRLLDHMKRTGAVQATPRLRPNERNMTPRAWTEEFQPNYLKRVLPAMPKQGDHYPWVNTQRYRKDKRMVLRKPVNDGTMEFLTAADVARRSAAVPV